MQSDWKPPHCLAVVLKSLDTFLYAAFADAMILESTVTKWKPLAQGKRPVQIPAQMVTDKNDEYDESEGGLIWQVGNTTYDGFSAVRTTNV